MFTHFKITHISGKSKTVDLNEFSIGDLEVIQRFYDDRDDFAIESILLNN